MSTPVKMAWELTPAEIADYARGMRARAAARAKELEARRERAWEVARQAATLLKQEFGATRVVLFGSLTRGPGRFYVRSDIDLAVWGLDERLYFKAVARLLDLDSEIGVDLVEAEKAKPSLMVAIEQDGIDL
jgi:predicted nucleotidyltransferase